MTAPRPSDPPDLSPRRLALLLLPAFGVALGAGFWLWSRTGPLVWFDSAAAFIAGCFG
jgi:hypothetical protein